MNYNLCPDDCEAKLEAKSCKEPCACIWYIDEVVFGDKKQQDCPVIKRKDKHGFEE